MPEHNPLVSIVINNYNYGRFLGEAIESALYQNYANTEVVVVDDGSTDNSREVISAYEEKIVPVLKENGGQASAFNAGFEASRGKIITLLDADDYLFPEAVDRIVEAWEPGVASIQYRLETVDGDGEHIGFYPPREIAVQGGEVWRILLERGYSTAPVTSGLSFWREALERVLPMPETEWRISADGYLITLVPFHGRVAAIQEALGAYRLHGSNLWSHQNKVSSEELLTLKFHKAVQHDLDKHALLVRKAKELDYTVPTDLSLRHYGNLQFRIALLHLDPENPPMPSDYPLKLAYRGVKAVWRYSGLPLKRRLKLVAWFVWVGLLPVPLARLAITWLFDSRSRPRVVEFLRWKERQRVRAL